MSLLIFIIVLGALVFVHELGHFLFAKLTKTKVLSFAIGFEPTLFKKKRGETTYKLNLIPFGGYVRIFGQDPSEDISKEPDRAYINKSTGAKLLILLGGVLFNFIFAWILLTAGLIMGTPSLVVPPENGEVVISSNATNEVLRVLPNSPADIAGIKPGDQILKVTVGDTTVEKPDTFRIRQLVLDNANKEVFKFEVLRAGEQTKEVSIVPASTSNEGEFIVGLSVEELIIKKLPFFSAIKTGFSDTVFLTKETFLAFKDLIIDSTKGEADISNLTGPVGMVGIVGDASARGFGYLLYFTALISINLAVLNLIPFPALDGGQIVFVLIESITKKKIPAKVATYTNLIGFGLLILLMIAVTIFDVVALF